MLVFSNVVKRNQRFRWNAWGNGAITSVNKYEFSVDPVDSLFFCLYSGCWLLGYSNGKRLLFQRRVPCLWFEDHYGFPRAT